MNPSYSQHRKSDPERPPRATSIEPVYYPDDPTPEAWAAATLSPPSVSSGATLTPTPEAWRKGPAGAP